MWAGIMVSLVACCDVVELLDPVPFPLLKLRGERGGAKIHTNQLEEQRLWVVLR